MKPKILIVDDDPVSLLLVSTIIEKGGYQPITACDAKSALEILRKEQPVLIIQDLSLPDLDGFHLAQCIHRMQNFTNIPVIILSGHDGRIASAKSSNEHFSAILIKPVNKEKLLDAIKKSFQEDVPASRSKMRS